MSFPDSADPSALDPTLRRLGSAAQGAVMWLALFPGGVFEDNLLDVSEMDSELWERVLAVLAEATVVSVERELMLAGRPFLRVHPALGAMEKPKVDAKLKQRWVTVYLAFATAIRKELFGAKPRWGVEVMLREEASVRRAVGFALETGNRDAASTMGEVLTKVLQTAGKQEERDRWAAHLASALESGKLAEEAAPALLENTSPRAEAPPVVEPPRPPPREREARASSGIPLGRAAQIVVTHRTTIEAGELAENNPPAAPSVEAPRAERPLWEERRSEGIELQREGALAVEQGRHDRAAELYMRALRFFQDAHDEEGVMNTCDLLGAMERAAGRIPMARAWYERALQMAQRRGDQEGVERLSQRLAGLSS